MITAELIHHPILPRQGATHFICAICSEFWPCKTSLVADVDRLETENASMRAAALKEIPILQDELLERDKEHHPFCGLTPCHEPESDPA